MLRGTTRQLFALSYRHFSAKTSLEQAVENKLKEKFSPSFLQVIDHSGGCPGGTLEVEIHSNEFAGKSEVQRSRAVQGALRDEISTVHAFILRAKPSQQ